MEIQKDSYRIGVNSSTLFKVPCLFDSSGIECFSLLGKCKEKELLSFILAKTSDV